MSEYQYYEFLAIDRPLTDRQQAEVRALSTRAHITATSFTNEYHWGDFRGDPHRMMERYYDAHLYLANWGTHQVMLRLPQTVLDPALAERYCAGDRVSAWTSGEHIILNFTSEAEEEYWEDDLETLPVGDRRHPRRTGRRRSASALSGLAVGLRNMGARRGRLRLRRRGRAGATYPAGTGLAQCRPACPGRFPAPGRRPPRSRRRGQPTGASRTT